MPPDRSHRLGVQIGGGADEPIEVLFVDPGLRGEKIGLQKDDAILSVNGEPIRSVEDLRNSVSSHDHLVLSIVRYGGTLTLTEKVDQKSKR